MWTIICRMSSWRLSSAVPHSLLTTTIPPPTRCRWPRSVYALTADWSRPQFEMARRMGLIHITCGRVRVSSLVLPVHSVIIESAVCSTPRCITLSQWPARTHVTTHATYAGPPSVIFTIILRTRSGSSVTLRIRLVIMCLALLFPDLLLIIALLHFVGLLEMTSFMIVYVPTIRTAAVQ